MITSFDLETKKPVLSKVKAVYKSSPVEMTRVICNCGKDIIGTPDQEFLTREGFKPLWALTVGESIGFARNKRIWWAAITEISPVGESELFQLEIEADNFIANGAIVR